MRRVKKQLMQVSFPANAGEKSNEFTIKILSKSGYPTTAKETTRVVLNLLLFFFS